MNEAILKKELLNRKRELTEKLSDHFGLEEEFAKESTGELSNYDNHPGDQGTELFERSKDTALNEHAEMELVDVNDALARMEKGEYGICGVCGEPIPFERLEAIPTADRCIEHVEEEVTERKRPIEEEVIDPHIRAKEGSAEEHVGYDGEDAWQEVNLYGSSDSPSDFFGDKESYDELYPNHK